MIEIKDASNFIVNYEHYAKKVYRIPLTYFDGRQVNILMCKCGYRWIALPYMSIGIMETQGEPVKNPPFTLFESEEGNLCATANVRWEIRDTKAYSNFLYSDKVNYTIHLRDLTIPLIDSYPPNVRHKIRKAYNNGLIVKQGGESLVNHFYKVYSSRMFEIGICPASKYYIRKRIQNGDYFLFVIYKDNKPVGAASLQHTVMHFMENEFFATDTEYNCLYTSYLLHYAMMQFAQSKDSDYSLGRSTYDSSVHHYKQHFKAETHKLYWSFSHRTKNIRNNKFLYSLWRLLPYRLVLLLAPFVSRRIY
ncbi:MAG: hypothetical protein LBR17_04410 [Bacteroidales bacterium]|jgi:hypothetical protein|nr:hypothetical protein [Bacteroidales bacterium]